MKRIGIFFVLIFLLVSEIYSQQDIPITICFHKRYSDYKSVIENAYNRTSIAYKYKIEYVTFDTAEENYFNNMATFKCDITMLEPAVYDKYYDYLIDINEQISKTLIERTENEADGNIYQRLLKDLRTSNREREVLDDTIRALPFFVDYGILYYRSDQIDNPPETWEALIEIVDQRASNSNNKNYIGQVNTDNEFYYNLIENVFSTSDKISYKVVERETRNTLSLFRQLFDYEIMDAFSWNTNSDNAINKFVPENPTFNSQSSNAFDNSDDKYIFMRNWSSYLYKVTKLFENNSKGWTFEKTKVLHSAKDKKSRAVNKGIYLGVTTKDKSRINEMVEVMITLTSKEFMQYLIDNVNFYDIPVYSSLFNTDTPSNEKYCKRIDCRFFRDLQKDHIVASYNSFFQHHFNDKFSSFYSKCKTYFIQGQDSENESDVTIDSLMTLFSNYFQDKYIEFNSKTSIIMIVVIAIEILITAVITFYIIKYRNFIEIRRSSPLFLIFMLIGIMLSFGSVLTLIGKPNNTICIIRPYIIVLAFGLTFYALLLKTFRIKVIFDKVNIQVKDSYLILYLCVVLGIELILLTIWSVFGGMVSDVNRVNDEIHYYTCKNTSNIGKFIQTFLIVINAIALLYGCYLAYKVKNVYSEYNESKIIGLSIYGIVICMVILFFIVSIDGLDINTLFLIESLMIIFSADIILLFMFTPKLWKLHVNNISYKNQQMYVY